MCVLLSLPKSQPEFGGLDPAEVQTGVWGVGDVLRPRADRVVSKRTPVNDDEIYTLMAKRLFNRVDAGCGGARRALMLPGALRAASAASTLEARPLAGVPGNNRSRRIRCTPN